MKTIAYLIAVFAVVASLFTLHEVRRSTTTQQEFVPNKETAIRIAEAVLFQIYGEQQIEKEIPFDAILRNGIWIVKGSLSGDSLGDVVMAQISQGDGRILRVSHGK